MEEVLQKTIDEGFTVFKFKVGTSIEADRERLSAVRKVLGYGKGYTVMIDANQVSYHQGFMVCSILTSTYLGVECTRSN